MMVDTMVSHDGFIFQTNSKWNIGEVTNLLAGFLKERKQCVILIKHLSTWKTISVGVPQGPILGPLSFVIYIRGLRKLKVGPLNGILTTKT